LKNETKKVEKEFEKYAIREQRAMVQVMMNDDWISLSNLILAKEKSNNAAINL
jgi:hypothetical protein